MEYLERNECFNDECESKEPLQRKVNYPKDLVEVDGFLPLIFVWIGMHMGRRSIACPTGSSAPSHTLERKMKSLPVLAVLTLCFGRWGWGRACGLSGALDDGMSLLWSLLRKGLTCFLLCFLLWNMWAVLPSKREFISWDMNRTIHLPNVYDVPKWFSGEMVNIFILFLRKKCFLFWDGNKQ